MAGRAPELIRVTYAPEGQVPVSVDIPRNRHSDSASRSEGRAIASAMMQLRPGVNAFHASDFQVDRVQDETARVLHHWQNKAEKPFKRSAHALTHKGLLHDPELQLLRADAVHEGRKIQKRNRRRRHEDPFFVPGRKRAQVVAWNPVFSTYDAARVATAGINTAVREVDVRISKVGIGRLAIPLKNPIEHTFHLDNPFLTPGLGKDNRDIVHELGPDKSVEEMQEYFSGLLRRFQDRELDPADIIHGVGKSLVDIVERHQSGLSGIFLTLAQAELPAVRDAIEAVFNVESITSADKGGSKFALLAYTAAEHEAFNRRVAKRNENQPTADELEAADPTLAQRTLSHVEQALSQFDWRPAALRRRLGEFVTTAQHRFIWYSTNVFEDQLDRRSERQDEIAMAYARNVLTAQGGSEAFKSYQRAVATAFANALTQKRTHSESFLRGLSGESSKLEQMIEEELMSKISPYWQAVIRKGLAALEGKKANLPATYTGSLKTLKQHETTDSYLDYMRYLYPLADLYSSGREDNPLVGKEFRDTRELWRQAKEYTEFIDGVRAAAHRVLYSNNTVRRGTDPIGS